MTLNGLFISNMSSNLQNWAGKRLSVFFLFCNLLYYVCKITLQPITSAFSSYKWNDVVNSSWILFWEQMWILPINRIDYFMENINKVDSIALFLNVRYSSFESKKPVAKSVWTEQIKKLVFYSQWLIALHCIHIDSIETKIEGTHMKCTLNHKLAPIDVHQPPAGWG